MIVRRILLKRSFSTFVDPFGAKRKDILSVPVEDHNKLDGCSKMIGDPAQGMADDTSTHPFGDLRISLARFNISNLCFWWEYDFTGGMILNNGQNALLSNNAKNKMYSKYGNSRTIQELAIEYKIRQQRVLAIVSLKEEASKNDKLMGRSGERYTGTDPPDIKPVIHEKTEDNKDLASKEISDEDWCKVCDWAEERVFRATADSGSGERHFVSVPTFPKFEEIPLSEVDKYKGKEWSISEINRMYTMKEDKFMVREFEQRLLLNTDKLGRSLDFKTDRTKMHRSPSKHPSPILVTSMDEDIVKPYVAQPDGSQRQLTNDEFLIWRRKNREAFTKLVAKEIEEKN